MSLLLSEPAQAEKAERKGNCRNPACASARRVGLQEKILQTVLIQFRERYMIWYF